MTDEQLHALKREFDELVALRDNLKATQERCNALVDENRDLKKKIASMEERWMQLLNGRSLP